MKRICIALIVLVLAGCASVSELREGKPYATLSTNKPAKQSAECIRDAWQNQRFGIEANGAALQMTGSTYTVVSPPSGLPQEIADISSDGSVTLYVQKSIDLGGRERSRRSAAASCM